MIDTKYIIILEESLINKRLSLSYDRTAKSRFLAECLYFFLIFGIATGLFYSRVFLIESESGQGAWNLVLAIIFLIWSIFVLLRAICLKPVKGGGIAIDKNGISSISGSTVVISWRDLNEVYILPWVIIFKSKNKEKLFISFFQKEFSQLERLFRLLLRSPPASQVKSFEKEMEINSILESMTS